MRPHLLAGFVLGGLLAAAGGCTQQSTGEVDFVEASVITDSPVGPLPGRAEAPLQAKENPFTGDLQALAEGRRYFVSYNCAGCHGDHGGGGMGPSLRDTMWLYGSSDLRIANSIAEGRAYGMPAWGRMLTEAQLWQLAAYIKSLRTPQEPQPPV